jgi:hypothetical protein
VAVLKALFVYLPTLTHFLLSRIRFALGSPCCQAGFVSLNALSHPLQAAAWHLSTAEYTELSVDERVAVLKALTALALDSEAVRDHVGVHINGPTDAVAEPKEPRVPRRPLVRYQTDRVSRNTGTAKGRGWGGQGKHSSLHVRLRCL